MLHTATTQLEQAFIVKVVAPPRQTNDALEAPMRALAAIRLPDTPGWLTGETPEAQGIETTMPNLPRDLQLPDLDERDYRLRVQALGRNAVRVQVAPPTHRMWSEPTTWPGIMVRPVVEPTELSVDRSGETLKVAFGDNALVIGRAPFTLSLEAAGRQVLRTGERLRQVAGFPMAPPVIGRGETISLNLEMNVDEQIFGFGEQFSRFEKTGQRLELVVNDALGTGTGLTYKPVPVWHSTAGYSAFINTGATVVADVGHSRPSVLGLDLDDAGLDLVVFTAPTVAERMADYTALTGRANRPPLWAFGYWMGRCRYHSADEMLEVGAQLRHHQVPADVLHCDPDWMIVDRLNTDYIWNEGRFGKRAQFISDLAELGLRLSVWQIPYIDPASPLFAEADAGGHLLRMPDGSLATLQGTPTPDGRIRALIDVTNPATREWLKSLDKPFFDDGMAAIKTDFGEGCPPGADAADGTPGNYIHNLFPLRYNAAFHAMTAELTGRPALVWGRSGWAGSQRYPGQWGGDAESTVVGMQATLRGGLSYAACAPGFWSHDIGGFYGPELTPGLYVRWTQMGSLSPLMRAHGLRPREPWQFGDEALEICRSWIRLRYSLLPYLWQAAGRVEREGVAMMTALGAAFDGDPIAVGTDDEYLFGTDLLVAPVMDDRMGPSHRRIYLPAGVWYDFFTDERWEGPAFIERDVPIDTMPVFVREGAVIPRVDVAAGDRNTDDLVGRPWILHVWGGQCSDAELRARDLEGFDGTRPTIADVIRHG